MSFVKFLNPKLIASNIFERFFLNSKKVGKLKVPKNISYDQLLKSCDIGLSTVMISRSVIKKNLFSSLKTKEDYLLWLKSIKYLKHPKNYRFSNK